MHNIFATFAIIAALFLAGCGQMGPLYEPDSDVPVEEPPTQETGIAP